MTKIEKTAVRDFVAGMCAARNGRKISISRSGAVNVTVGGYGRGEPLTRLFVGWADEILRNLRDASVVGGTK